MTATPKLPPAVKAARAIKRAEKALLSPHEFGLMQHVLISLSYVYLTSPKLVMGTGGGSRNTTYARQALAVAGKELHLSWHKIAQFMGVAHTTAIYHHNHAAHEQIAAGIGAAEEAMKAIGPEREVA